MHLTRLYALHSGPGFTAMGYLSLYVPLGVPKHRAREDLLVRARPIPRFPNRPASYDNGLVFALISPLFVAWCCLFFMGLPLLIVWSVTGAFVGNCMAPLAIVVGYMMTWGRFTAKCRTRVRSNCCIACGHGMRVDGDFPRCPECGSLHRREWFPVPIVAPAAPTVPA